MRRRVGRGWSAAEIRRASVGAMLYARRPKFQRHSAAVKIASGGRYPKRPWRGGNYH